MKLLLNAESFGFGPSASISAIFDIINKLFPNYQVDYIGSGHSLDLQSHLPYHKIYEFNENTFSTFVKNYDFFITALDFEKAKKAKESGVKTIIYDTLLWYWKDKNIVHYADYYITQDFYGVKEIVESLELENTLIIPPLIQKKEVSQKNKNLLLINFGGLENPFWDIHVTTQYIDNILSTILPILEEKFNNIRIVCSKKHLNHLKKYPVTSVSYQEMQELLQEAKFIIATSGLGNIYEIANYQIPSLFLPPVNDSQGQQLEILQQVGLIDNCLNWKDFQSSINYFDEQKNVLNQIKYEIENFDKNRFSDLFQEKNYANLDLKSLFDEFGDNGSLMLSNYLKLILK